VSEGGFKFSREINLGHLLQVGSLIVAIVVFSVATDRRFTMLEIRQSYFEKMVDQLDAQSKSLADNQEALIRNQERTTTILEMMKKKP